MTPGNPAGYFRDGKGHVTQVITPKDYTVNSFGRRKVRISCQTWDKFRMAFRQLGVLYEDPGLAIRIISSHGLTVQERILSRDGQREWTISRRQRRGRI